MNVRTGILLLLLGLAGAREAAAVVPGRVGLHALRLMPRGDSDDYSDASWGGGLEVIVPLSATGNLVAVDFVGAIVNFESETIIRVDPSSLLRTEQSNSQNLARFGTGLRLGPHGHGLFQPFVGVHGYLVAHAIRSTLLIPDDFDETHSVQQDLGSESDWGVGWDATAGLHLNFGNRFGAYGGVSYFRSAGLDRPLGEDEVTVDPEYTDVYAGLSVSFGSFGG